MVPENPGVAFTATLVAGSLSSIATPTVIGALTPHVGLATAAVTVASATALVFAGETSASRSG